MDADFLIVGAGIGGLCAALALHDAGRRVVVCEQSPLLGEVGAGVMLGPNATRVLARLGIGDDLARLGYEPKFTLVRDGKDGTLLSRTEFGAAVAQADGARIYHIHRADLHGALVKAVEARDPRLIRRGKSLIAISQSGSHVTAAFADGERVTCAALIGADGIKSCARQYIAPDASARFTGNIAWRGLVPAAGLRPEQQLAESTVWVGERRHVVRYAVKGGTLINYVALAERETWTDEGWTARSDVSEILREFAGWHPDVVDLIAKTPADACFKWGLFDRDPLPHWSKGRVTLLGDAAHPMLPFLAQGAAMAIEDAAVLARMLDRHSDVEAAFAAYEQARLPRTSWVQAQSRQNQKLYHAGSMGRAFDEDRALRAERLYRYDAFAE